MRALHHVGIVLRNERAMQQFMKAMELEEDYRGTVPEWNALCVFTKAIPGASPIEFVIAEEGPLKAFNKGLGGVHHVALTVPDLRAAIAEHEAQGMRLVAPGIVKGAGSFLCAFIEPAYTGNALIELVEVLPS
jgi:methylmalonyl-CoA/ethylmalonyl-CoA epimerase